MIPNGAGFRARLFPGDRIVAIEGEDLSNLDALREMYHRYDEAEKGAVLLTVMRRHSRRWILIEASYEN